MLNSKLIGCWCEKKPISCTMWIMMWLYQNELGPIGLPHLEIHEITFYFFKTFTFMHLADAFIQSDLQLHSGYTFSLVCVFPGNRTHNLLRCWRNALPLSHTGKHLLSSVEDRFGTTWGCKNCKHFFCLQCSYNIHDLLLFIFIDYCKLSNIR